MKILLSPGAVMPSRAHADDAGLDLFSPVRKVIRSKIITPELELVDSLDDTERGSGGFGSTGK